MDLDMSFLSAVLCTEGGYYNSKREGVSSKVLQGEHAIRGWEFVDNHVLEFGSVPSADFFTAKTGISLIEPQAELPVLIKDLKARSLWSSLRAAHEKAGGMLEERNADGAFTVFQEAVFGAYREKTTGSRVDNILSLGGDVLDYYDRMKNGERGIPTPWEAMNEATLGWWDGDFVVIVARMGVGKCVSGDTEIPDPITGVYRPIRDVVRDRLPVLTRDKYGSYSPVMPSMHINTGHKECLRITTRSGLELEATPEHPFSVAGGWKRADELSAGDYVETVKRMPFPLAARDDCSEHEVRLLAALLADGGLTLFTPTFSKLDSGVLDVVRDAVASMGVELVKHKGMNESTWALSDSSGHGKNAARDMLTRWGVGRSKSVDKVIPDAVFGLSNRLLSVFLGVLWSCDGCVESTGKLSICFSSKKMVSQVKRLLLRFGITCRMREKENTVNGSVFKSWEIRVHSTCHRLFKDNIPLVGEKRERLLSVCDSVNPNVDSVPINDWVVEKIDSAIKRGRDRGLRISDVGKAMGWSSTFSRSSIFNNKTISKKVLSVLADFYGDDELSSLCDPYWDEIVSVEPVGVKDVFDLTVMGTHCFVANDIVAHNTFCMLMLARHAWMSGKKVLFVGTEMNRVKLAIRLYSIHLKLPYREIRSGTLGEYQEQKLRDGIAEMMEQDGLYVVGDDFDASIQEIEAAVDEVRPDIVLVDGIYLVKNEGRDRHTRVSNTADDLKRMAKRRGIPIIASSQFNREVDPNSKAKVSAENIGITDVIGWNADVIYGMYQTDDMDEDDIMGFRPMKLREGEGKDFFTQWKFSDMSFDQTEDGSGSFTDTDYDSSIGVAVGDDDDGWGDDDDQGALF